MTAHASPSMVTREALYQEVWTTPVGDVARKYGVSGRGFAKLCAREGVPVPPRGYWAKIRAGRKVKRPPLPARLSGRAPGIEIRPTTDAAPPWHARTPSQTFDPAVGEMLERVLSTQPVDVRTDLRRAHPVARQVAAQIEEYNRESKARGWPVDARSPASDVTPQLERRALLILDGIVRGLAAHGIAVAPWDRAIGVSGALFGRTFNICVRERMGRVLATKATRWTSSRWDMVRSGKLEIRIDVGGSWDRRGWKDGAAPLEQRVGDVLPRVLHWIDQKLREQAARDRERREREEQERQRKEVETRRLREIERREEFLAEAEDWDRCARARTYLAAVERRLLERHGSIAEGSGACAWLTWARGALDEMDPIARTERVCTSPSSELGSHTAISESDASRAATTPTAPATSDAGSLKSSASAL